MFDWTQNSLFATLENPRGWGAVNGREKIRASARLKQCWSNLFWKTKNNEWIDFNRWLKTEKRKCESFTIQIYSMKNEVKKNARWSGHSRI